MNLTNAYIMDKLKQSTIGIWGFGRVGQAFLHFCWQNNISCTVFDQRKLTPKENVLIKQQGATVIQHKNIDQFLSSCQIVLPSPGININPHAHKAHFITELDIFCAFWQKPLVAITGTVGKTTITTLLSTLINQQITCATGGNIGTPMLDLLSQQEQSDCALLELSSWQLEHAHTIKPSIAIWTNCYANHLDRHNTMQAYFMAKAHILMHQDKNNYAIVDWHLRTRILQLKPHAQLCFIADSDISTQLKQLQPSQKALFVQNNNIILVTKSQQRVLCHRNDIPHHGFIINWLFILATLQRLALPITLVKSIQPDAIEHRLEPVQTKKSGTYINDSKSTTIESTLAAVKKFHDKPIKLIIGGLSKGVDRTPLIEQLPANVQHVYCFGKEATILKQQCDAHHMCASSYEQLEPIMAHIAQSAHSTDIILFSPAGSSFDLYRNYEQRGKHFKQLTANT